MNDDELTELLAQRLPQHPAPLALKRHLAGLVGSWGAPGAPQAPPTPQAPRAWRRRAFVIPALAAAAVLLVVGPFAYDRAFIAPARATDRLFREAVDDHVRVLQNPLGIESDGQHEVKPWFTGKLDFAPTVAFMGDDEFPLRGGAVGYYLDRPAAVLVYGRRRHTISLLVFRADGLALPARPAPRTQRGFNVVLWRADDLGYALVSDVDRAELQTLAAKLSP
jgi:anti-sigma factor RsiW